MKNLLAEINVRFFQALTEENIEKTLKRNFKSVVTQSFMQKPQRRNKRKGTTIEEQVEIYWNNIFIMYLVYPIDMIFYRKLLLSFRLLSLPEPTYNDLLLHLPENNPHFPPVSAFKKSLAIALNFLLIINVTHINRT